MRLFFVGWLVWGVLWLLFPRSIFGFRDPYTIDIPGFIVFMVWWGVGIFSQVYRYAKVSGPLERQQTKYITFGATLVEGQQAALVTAVSTLLIATFFNPLRKRLQAEMDRNFYRQRYDAEHVVAEFVTVAHSETDLDILTEKLSCIVNDALQPTAVSLWPARDPSRKTRQAGS